VSVDGDTATVATTAAAIASGERSSREVVEALLRRIDETEPVLNAYVLVAADEALLAARALDDLRSARCELGPLHGVPISVKDLYATRGMETAAGGTLLRGHVPDEDAEAVARLRQAGAIVIGKTNTHEYAYGYTTENPHFGATRNPWDTGRIAGGSSGGSGASVAAGSAIAALGSDTGGSIRVPAAFCGIAGIKPTYGRVSRRGVVPLSWSLDHAGPMARTSEDLAILLAVLAGFDRRDPASADEPVPDYRAALDGELDGVRVGVPANHFFEPIDDEVGDAVEAAILELEKLGARRRAVRITHLDSAVGAWLTILLCEAASFHERDLRDRPEAYGEDVRLYLEQGTLVSALAYLKAQRLRAQLVAAFRKAMRDLDVLVVPTTPLAAPPLATPTVRVGGQDEPLFLALARTCSPLDMVGLPAASTPCGFTTNNLPIGLQVVGHPFREDVVLRVTAAYERATQWLRRPRL
jgi:aspartyl-tRNA(Asn)/glutamyl-tRNA(Gln) amidotransferase subunit A